MKPIDGEYNTWLIMILQALVSLINEFKWGAILYFIFAAEAARLSLLSKGTLDKSILKK